MSDGTLTDLDELVLTVRNRNSREYISEAVNDYRARSLRSSVAATWVAVTYDIISKIRELAQQGDAEAVKFSTDLDNAIVLRVSNPGECKKRLQAIEGDLLDYAHSKFEFLSDQEFRDMGRLYEDRNLCAHPALAGGDLLFQPLPELVRTYLVQAIRYLLQHPPVQGKSALLRLKADLLQPSFPSTQQTVLAFLDARYFKHMKSALLDNIVTILLKVIVNQTEPALIGREDAVVMSLVAVSIRYPERFAKRMQQELPKVCDGADESQLKRAMRLFAVDRRCWAWLDSPAQIQMTEIVKKYRFQKADIDSVACCMELDELRPLFADCVESFTAPEKQAVYTTHPHEIFVSDAITAYLGAGSFRNAEELFEYSIRPFAGVFRAEHIRMIVDGADCNGQISSARDTPQQLAFLFIRSVDLLTPETVTSWQTFLRNRLQSPTERDHYGDLQHQMALNHIWPVSSTP